MGSWKETIGAIISRNSCRPIQNVGHSSMNWRRFRKVGIENENPLVRKCRWIFYWKSWCRNEEVWVKVLRIVWKKQKLPRSTHPRSLWLTKKYKAPQIGQNLLRLFWNGGWNKSICVKVESVSAIKLESKASTAPFRYPFYYNYKTIFNKKRGLNKREYHTNYRHKMVISI